MHPECVLLGFPSLYFLKRVNKSGYCYSKPVTWLASICLNGGTCIWGYP